MAGHTTLKKCCASLLVGLWAVLGGAEAMAPRGTTNYIKLVNRNRPASIQKIYKIVGRAGAAAAVRTAVGLSAAAQVIYAADTSAYALNTDDEASKHNPVSSLSLHARRGAHRPSQSRSRNARRDEGADQCMRGRHRCRPRQEAQREFRSNVVSRALTRASI